jgi:hypothetical protein
VAQNPFELVVVTPAGMNMSAAMITSKMSMATIIAPIFRSFIPTGSSFTNGLRGGALVFDFMAIHVKPNFSF